MQREHKILWTAGLLLVALGMGGGIWGSRGSSEFRPPNENTEYFQADEFNNGNTASGQIGALGWTSSLLGSCTITVPTFYDARYPSLIQLSTGTTSGSVCSLYLGSLTRPWIPPASSQSTQTVCLLGQNATNITNVTNRIGLASDITNPPTYGIYLEVLNTDSNWFVVARDVLLGSQRQDTGIARIGGQELNFCVNYRDSKVTATANITNAQPVTVSMPTTDATWTPLLPFYQVVNASTVTRQVLANSFFWYRKIPHKTIPY